MLLEAMSLRLPRRDDGSARSEEHTSELQSLRHLVCRLLLEKKKNRRVKSENRYIAQFRLEAERGVCQLAVGSDAVKVRRSSQEHHPRTRARVPSLRRMYNQP